MKKYYAPRTNVNDWSALMQTSLTLFAGLQLHNNEFIKDKEEHLKEMTFLSAKIFYFIMHQLPSFVL